MNALLKDPALVVGLIRAALILLLSLVLTGVTVSRTTSKANPVLSSGTTVEVITPEGQQNYLKTL
jgi:hypothetical protein